MAQANCSICHGTGFVVSMRPDHLGQQAAPCDCTKANQLDHAWGRTQIPNRFYQVEFDSFTANIWTEADHGPNAPAYNRSLANAKFVVEAFAKEYPISDHKGILLMGPSGTGKTHLAVSALRVLMARGHQVLFHDFHDLLKELQNSYSNNAASEKSILETVIGVEILLIVCTVLANLMGSAAS